MATAALTEPPQLPLAEPGRFSARQEEVLDVVEQVFLREGLRAVRIGPLAAEARCSRSTLYELAPSKEELLLIVLDRMMNRIMSRGVEAIRRESDPVEQIRAMLTSGALDFAPLGPRFMEAVRDYPPAKLLFDRRIADSRDAFELLVRQGVSAGDYRPVDPRVVAEAIFVVVLRFTEPEFVRSAGVSSSEALHACVDLVVDGLRPR